MSGTLSHIVFHMSNNHSTAILRNAALLAVRRRQNIKNMGGLRHTPRSSPLCLRDISAQRFLRFSGLFRKLFFKARFATGFSLFAAAAFAGFSFLLSAAACRFFRAEFFRRVSHDILAAAE